MGTVCFDEISQQSYIGRILKPFGGASVKLEANSQGRIIFDFNDEYVIDHKLRIMK